VAILHLFDRFRQNSEPINDSVNKIKQGDVLLKENFIRDYKPFILKVVSKTTGKFVDMESSEEFSIGLMAFNEAIECFDENKNSSFLKFAETVIKRRLIDYFRSNNKHSKVFPFTYFEGEKDNSSGSFEERYLKVEESTLFDSIETREEIDLFVKKLGEFGISLRDLVESAPKHVDSKKLAIEIARTMAENAEISDKLEKTKKIPMKELMQLVSVNHKTVERNRKFIIAVYFILSSKLEVMKGYVENIERGGRANG
jgi:RNA polymerase sigma-I factor